MIRTDLPLRTALLLLPLLFLGQPGHAESSEGEDRKAIEEAYGAWVEATNAKDLETWASFLAPGALFHPPNSPALTDERAIRTYYAELFADRRFGLDCRQDHVEVAVSRDLAWSTGRCEATFTAPDGSEGRDTSKWAKVWKRQTDGTWKCALNTWNSTLGR